MPLYGGFRIKQAARRVLLGGVAVVAVTGSGCGQAQQAPPVMESELDWPTWRKTMAQGVEYAHLAEEALKKHDVDSYKELDDRAVTYYRIGRLQKQAAEFAAQGADESASRLLDEAIRLERPIDVRAARFRTESCRAIKQWFAEHPTAQADEEPCAKVQVQDSGE